jgi:hypothetical protein
VIWSYSGVRALYDDGARDAKDVTRDYRLELDSTPGPKLLSVFGGKITTARALALEALDPRRQGLQVHRKLDAARRQYRSAAFNASLARARQLAARAPRQPPRRAYGTRLARLLDGATSIKALGRHFGAGLYEARGPLAARRRIRPHRRRHLMAPHQARPGNEARSNARRWRRGCAERPAPRERRLASSVDPYANARLGKLPARPAWLGSGDSVIGWKLDREQRAELLLQFPPRYASRRRPCHAQDQGRGRRRPARRDGIGEIVGRADDGEGVEAMVVRIGGTTDRPTARPTTSPGRSADGRRAKESNDVIAALGWTAFDLPMPVALTPARFR